MIANVLYVLLLCVLVYLSYQRAQRNGTWSWKLLAVVVGSIALFGAGYMAPMINSQWLARHPNDFLWVIFGPMMVMIAGLYFYATRMLTEQKRRREAEE